MVPRTRWAVTIIFGVIADSNREATKPKKKRTRTNLSGLVHVKRMTLALLFVQAFWSGQVTVERAFFLDPLPRDLALIVDASPFGAGGILVHLETGEIMAGFSYEIVKEDAEELGVELGSHAAQSAFEFLGSSWGSRTSRGISDGASALPW